MAGLGGLSKLNKLQSPMKGSSKPPESGGKVSGDDGPPSNGGEASSQITHHADGSHTMVHDGEESKHPDHLHLMAHLGYKLTGDKHHVAHHDGMGITTHGVRETGEHEGPQEHNSAEDAKQAFGQFMDEEAQEPQHQHGMEAPVGGMAY